MADIVYLLWSNKHDMWWAPNARGYTPIIDEAGRYSQSQALGYVLRSAACGQLDQVTCMVAAPDNWTRSLADPAVDKAADIAEQAARDDHDERSTR